MRHSVARQDDGSLSMTTIFAIDSVMAHSQSLPAWRRLGRRYNKTIKRPLWEDRDGSKIMNRVFPTLCDSTVKMARVRTDRGRGPVRQEISRRRGRTREVLNES